MTTSLADRRPSPPTEHPAQNQSAWPTNLGAAPRARPLALAPRQRGTRTNQHLVLVAEACSA
eukprot:2213806-Lingulodinium_polyedra.AAC.1